MKKEKFKFLSKLNVRIFAIVLAVLAVIFSAYILFSTGIFDKDPTVSTQANNTYSETIRVITDEDYQPYSFYDKNGKASGHDVELINTIANKMEVNLQLDMLPWQDAVDELTAGNADVLMTCGVSDIIGGSNQPIKTAITSTDEYVVYSKKSLNDLYEVFNGKLKVGYMENGNAEGVLSSMGLLNDCIAVDTNKNILLKVQSGELDAGIMRHVIGTTLLDELKIKNVKARYSLSPSYMCFSVNPAKADLANKINQVIGELRENGQLKKLNKKWLTTFVQPNSVGEILANNLWMPFVFVALIACLLFSIFLSNNRINKINDQLATELDELQKRNMIIEGLSGDFDDVCFVTLVEDKRQDSSIILRHANYFTNLNDENVKFSKRLDLIVENFVYEDDKERFYNATRRELIINNLIGSEAYFVRFRGVIDGEIYYYEMKFNPLRDKDGNVTNYVVGIHNVDKATREMLEQEEKLEQAKRLAEQASKAKTSFLFNMSHDIRTPMNAISGYTHLAKENIKDPEKLDGYLSKIDMACGNLIELINQVLEMSRIESGKVELQNTRCNIFEKMSAILNISEANAALKNIKITTKYENLKNNFVLTDAGRVNQIVTNVIGNAVKYTRENGQINITISQENTDNPRIMNYKFVVEDNGVGMSEEFLNHIFEEFAREKNTTTSGIQGTGLGMSIVKHLVDILNGTIEIDSKLNVGTKVSIVLPLLIDEDSNNKEIATNEEADINGMKILLVEDNEMNMEIAEAILISSGVEVLKANDGDVAVEKVKELKPGDIDLILMDVQMPRMNGYEATRAIRALNNKKLANIPIVAMTANAFDEDKKMAVESGMNGHIGKPFDVKQLKKIVASFRK